MRLTPEQQHIIKTTLLKHFGESSRIWLFGSRADDHAKGGDIDLYLEPEIQMPDAVVEAKLNALVALRQALGDQKIDLVIRRQQAEPLPIHRMAREKGVSL